MSTVQIVGALSCGALFLAALFMTSKRGRAKNPPGPTRLPLLGNLLNLPQKRQWEAFARWKDVYGDIIYFNVFGASIVVLNSIDVCTDLFEKRSSKYSGRPGSILLNEYMDYLWPFSSMDYGPRWRKYRRLFHSYFNEHVSPTYQPIQDSCVHQFLLRLLNEPSDFRGHIRLLFGQTVLNVVYDIKVEDKDDIYVQAAEKSIAAVNEVTLPGRFLVEFFPAMKYLPSWCPGGTFKRYAAKHKHEVHDVKDLPFAYVKEQMKAGTASTSVLSSMLAQCDQEPAQESSGDEDPEDVAKNCAGIAYLGGADTTTSMIQAFFLAVANRDDVQRAARKELDLLLGSSPDRLPTYADKDHLPFVEAISKELLRWHNVLPLIPHSVTEDDVYNGYLIRKGTIILANIWAISHDPQLYPEPHTFNPWRWLMDTPEGPKLNPEMPDPEIIFGLGRRICPGRHFASHSLFTTIASVLACFEIRPLDANGQPTDHIAEVFTDGLMIYPADFNVSITPRSAHVAQLVRDVTI